MRTKKTILVILLQSIPFILSAQKDFRSPELMKKANVHFSYYYEVSYDKYFIGEIAEFTKDGRNSRNIYTHVDSTTIYTSDYKYNEHGDMVNQTMELYKNGKISSRISNHNGYDSNGKPTIDSTFTNDTLTSITNYTYKQGIYGDYREISCESPPSYYNKYISDFDSKGNMTNWFLIDLNNHLQTRISYFYAPNGQLEYMLEYSNAVYERHIANHDTTIIYTEETMNTLTSYDRKTVYTYNEGGQVITEATYTLMNNELFLIHYFTYNDKGLLIKDYAEYPNSLNRKREIRYRYEYY